MKKRLSKMAALVSALALLFTTIACDLPSAKDPTQEETQTQEDTPTQEAPTPVLKPAATPTITVENNTVTITSTTKNAKIYYTVDGTAPSTESTEYTKAFEITKTVTVKAIATAQGFEKSEVATKECEYVMPVTAKPLIKNTDNSITITCETEAAVIYYTTDGTAPTTDSTKYTEAFIITANTTVQAFASAEGFAASEIVKEELEYVAPGSVGTPKIEQTGNTVKITCPTSGASIYYTDDGSAPSASSKPYTSEITLTKSVTIKAIAVKADCTDSTVTSQECTYTAPKAEKPVIAVSDNKVTITAEGFDIYYTTDGSEPSSESTKYTAAFDISAETTVKAIAVKEGYTNSDIAEKACSYVAPTPAPTPTPEPAAVEGNHDDVSTPTKPDNTVKTITLVKNEYAGEGKLETQVKIETGFDSLAIGDKVNIIIKGKADKALGNAEIIPADTTEAASYWKNLATPYNCKFGLDFEISTEFTITDTPDGSGPASTILAINGKDGDETVNLWCTEFSITKTSANGAEEIAEVPTDDNIVWEGEAILYWEGENKQTVDISANLLSGKTFNTFKLTYTANGGSIKFQTANNGGNEGAWVSLATLSVSENGTKASQAAENPSEDETETWLWGNQTNATVKIKFADSEIDKFKSKGLQIFGGNNITITKVELVTE